MRTTLDIDDDVLAAVKDLAKAEGKTAGAVLSSLARRALTTPTPYPIGFAEDQSSFGEAPAWITFPDRGGAVVTQELIDRIQDEIDQEDAVAWDHQANAPVKPD